MYPLFPGSYLRQKWLAPSGRPEAPSNSLIAKSVVTGTTTTRFIAARVVCLNEHAGGLLKCPADIRVDVSNGGLQNSHGLVAVVRNIVQVEGRPLR